MAQRETEQLTRILTSAALSRVLGTIAELGVADLIQAGQPQPVRPLDVQAKAFPYSASKRLQAFSA